MAGDGEGVLGVALETQMQGFDPLQEQASTGVTPELVRLSVGIEDIRDILADLDQAIEAANGYTAQGALNSKELAAR